MGARRKIMSGFLKKVRANCIITLALAFLILAAVSAPALAEDPYNYTWAAPGIGDQYITPLGIAADENNNTYVAGHFQGSYQLGPASLNSEKNERNRYTSQEAFVAKLGVDGEWIWASQAKPGGYSKAHSIAVDSQGNSYITGQFRGTAQFGAISLETAGFDDIFVAKLDRNGNWVWAQRAGGDSSFDNALAIALDQQNNVYVTGTFSGTADFGRDVLSVDVASNLFVAKLDNNGNWLWVRTAAGAGPEGGTGYTRGGGMGQALAVGPDGVVFVAGDFVGHSGVFGSIIVEWDSIDPVNSTPFLASLDADGNWGWVVPYKLGIGDTGAITADRYGNCYLAGSLRYFECGDETYFSSEYTDVFIAMFNNRGKLTKFIKSEIEGTQFPDKNWVYGLAVDKEGNAYIAGRNAKDIKFGETVLENRGYYIAKCNIFADNWEWANPVDGAVGAMAMDAQDQLYVAGNFKKDAVFDDITLENKQYDMAENLFVAKAQRLNGSGSLPSGFPYYAFDKWAAEPAVSPNHIFKVKFSLPLDRAVLENGADQAVYVRTAGYEVVPVTLQFAGQGQDTVQVTPAQPYLPGATYYLYIDRAKIFSSPATGAKQLPQTIVMKFTTN